MQFIYVYIYYCASLFFIRGGHCRGLLYNIEDKDSFINTLINNIDGSNDSSSSGNTSDIIKKRHNISNISHVVTNITTTTAAITSTAATVTATNQSVAPCSDQVGRQNDTIVITTNSSVSNNNCSSDVDYYTISSNWSNNNYLDSVSVLFNRIVHKPAAAAARRYKVFQGGYWQDLHSMLDISNGDKILYVSNHMYEDILRCIC